MDNFIFKDKFSIIRIFYYLVFDGYLLLVDNNILMDKLFING